ncbi:Na+/H+ antiporter subunit E [Lysobacter soli]|uniref:Na+/H+ antiporter subunit E n=1 Tax=Lysobacter soli TaxID=453783 RepID=UPI0024105F58|nr:Na+/H+ antiporter subunit E [Lysobacter soli]MDG2518014.1 Na+/H+ antiporter subunit E [Lysobacter soli]
MTFLRRLLPSPALSVALLAIWLLLARSASAGQLVLGLIVAIGVPVLVSSFWPPSRARHPFAILRYTLLICGDVVHSNLVVAWGVVRWRWHRPAHRFVVIPLDLRDPVGLAVLSMVTTVVPGTVWSELAVDRSAMLLHVWDAPDEADFVARFKARYEAPLREIFE